MTKIESPQMERVCTKQELAEFFGLKSVRTIENWMREGLIPFIKIKKVVRFNIPEVQAALNQRCGKNRKGLR